MSWYKSWFNSPYYHILYQHRDEEEAEHFLDNLIGFLKPVPGTSILDLACGRGRHSVYLNSKGFEVTGIDLSPESIEYCMQFENEHLSFFVHDMRNLFRINDFDYVLNLFTSFGYFESEKENADTIKNACFALKPGGKLVIDFLNSAYVTKKLVENEKIISENISFHIRKKIANGFLLKKIEFTDKGNKFEYTEKVRTLRLPDFENYLLPLGMKIIHLFGDYELNNFDESASQRLIIIAEKPVQL